MTPLASELASIAIVAVAYGALLGMAELGRRRWHLDGELTRKGVHVGGGLIALSFPWLFAEAWPVVLLGVGFSGVLASSAWRGELLSIHDVRRRTVGALIYPLAVAMAFVLSHQDPTRYCVAILALSLGDAAAGLVGCRFGATRFLVWGTARSVEGSAAAFGSSAAAAVLILAVSGADVSLFTAILVGSMVAVVEAVSPSGTDNVTVPLAALAAMAGPSVAVPVAVASVALLVAGWPTERGSDKSAFRGGTPPLPNPLPPGAREPVWSPR